MTAITLEKTHALLEKLAEHVMNVESKIDARFARLEAKLDLKADKSDLQAIDAKIENIRESMNAKFNMLLEGMDNQAGQMNDLIIEMKAVSKTLDIHNERLGNLEERNFGYRVRDKEGE